MSENSARTQRDDVSADATPVTARVHRSKVGTYHPEPCLDTPCQAFELAIMGDSPRDHCLDGKAHCVCYHNRPCNGVAWTINDTRGYTDGGPSCEECGKCECEWSEGGSPACVPADPDAEIPECIGLSFAFVCLDGGEALCETCATKAGVEIVECDCE